MPYESPDAKPLDALGNATMRLDSIYGAFAKRHGETYLSMWAIDELGHHPEGLTQKQLATALYAPKQTVSSLTASLEKRGLVCTEASPNDKRSKIHKLSSQGRALYNRTLEEQSQCDRACIQKLGAERIERMIADVNDTLSCIEEALAHLEEGGDNHERR